MSYRLIITEKPSVAQAITKALHVTGRKDGYMEGNGYLISWCFGHLVELVSADAYDEKYAKWNKKDLPIIPEEWKYQVTKEKAKQFKIVKSLMNRKDLDPACPMLEINQAVKEVRSHYRPEKQSTEKVKSAPTKTNKKEPAKKPSVLAKLRANQKAIAESGKNKPSVNRNKPQLS